MQNEAAGAGWRACRASTSPLVTWLPADLMDEMIPPPRTRSMIKAGSPDDGAPAIHGWRG